jgi:lipoprotein signal peptidase
VTGLHATLWVCASDGCRFRFIVMPSVPACWASDSHESGPYPGGPWPIINVADIAVAVGVIGVAVTLAVRVPRLRLQLATVRR